MLTKFIAAAVLVTCVFAGPLVAATYYVVGVTSDIAGAAVPQGAGPDIGAYEAPGGE